MAIDRLSGGLTPADGSDPRTFPAIWNATAGEIETAQSDITTLQGSAVALGSAVSAIEADLLPTDVSSPVSGDSLVYDGSQWVNGPRSGNAIINGDFGIWQRGTSFTQTGAGGIYTSDRWRLTIAGGGSTTISRQSFTPADIEVAGYGDAEFYLRANTTDVTSMTTNLLSQRVEDVRVFSNQTVTISFWAKATTGFGMLVQCSQQFGSGGSAAVNVSDTVTLTTSWQKYSVTLAIPSVSGKTIGSGSYLDFRLFLETTGTNTVDVWGVQLEAGPVATPFKLAGGGSKAAELALCQRYYQVHKRVAASRLGFVYFDASTVPVSAFPLPVEMRTTPSGQVTSLGVRHSGTTDVAITGLSIVNNPDNSILHIGFTVGSGPSAGAMGMLRASALNGGLSFDAEL